MTDTKTNGKLTINVGLLDLYRGATGDFGTGDSWMAPDRFILGLVLHSTEYSKDRWLLNMLHDSKLTWFIHEICHTAISNARVNKNLCQSLQLC